MGGEIIEGKGVYLVHLKGIHGDILCMQAITPEHVLNNRIHHQHIFHPPAVLLQLSQWGHYSVDLLDFGKIQPPRDQLNPLMIVHLLVGCGIFRTFVIPNSNESRKSQTNALPRTDESDSCLIPRTQAEIRT